MRINVVCILLPCFARNRIYSDFKDPRHIYEFLNGFQPFMQSFQNICLQCPQEPFVFLPQIIHMHALRQCSFRTLC